MATPCQKFSLRKGDFSQVEWAARDTLGHPIYPELTLSQQDEVIEAVSEFSG